MALFSNKLDGNSVLLLVPASQFMKVIFAFFLILITLIAHANTLTLCAQQSWKGRHNFMHKESEAY